MTDKASSPDLPDFHRRVLQQTAKRLRAKGFTDSSLSFEQLEFRLLQSMEPIDHQCFAIDDRLLARWRAGEPRKQTYLDMLDEKIALYRALDKPTPEQVVQLSELIERRESVIEDWGGDPRRKES